jgi:putative transposase
MHYVLQRGHNRQAVFFDEQDRAAYVSLLQEAAAQYGVAIHAYALLEAEVHLLATPTRTESFSRLMQSLGRGYVATFNRRHGRSGTLWAGRFSTRLVDGATLGLDATLYVESLPMLAGLVAAAEEWPWSSAAHHIGRRRDPLLSEHPSYWAQGNTPFERELAHAIKLHGGVSTGLGRQFVAGSALALGSPAFLARMAEQSGVSLQTRPRGRPARARGAN